MWYKEKNDSCKLSFDFHMHTTACALPPNKVILKSTEVTLCVRQMFAKLAKGLRLRMSLSLQFIIQDTGDYADHVYLFRGCTLRQRHSRNIPTSNIVRDYFGRLR